MRVLVVADSHVPERAAWLPKPVEEYVLSESFDAVIHAGDVVEEELIMFFKENVSRELLVVRGNMDHLRLPRYARVSLEGVELGVVHGDGVYPRGNVVALTRIARNLGVKVLVSGHTHVPLVVYDKSGILHVNPGSVTGVWGGGGGSGVPSFVELTISSRTVSVTVYELVADSLLRRLTHSYTF